MGNLFGSVSMLNHGMTFNLGSARVCSPAIFKTYFSYHKGIWIAGISAVKLPRILVSISTNQ